MLSREEEAEIRETVRRSLDSILKSPGEKSSEPVAGAPPELERIADAKRIIGDETEQYYTKLGLVKHVSRSNQIFWVTPAERDRLLRSRRRRSHHRGMLARINPRVALIWGATILIAVLLVAYLVSTETFGGFMSS